MLVGQIGNILHQVGLVDTVWNLGDYNLIVGLGGLDFGLGTHHDTSPTRLVGITHTSEAIDIGTCGEVGTRDELHQSVGVDVRIVNIGTATVNNFT